MTRVGQRLRNRMIDQIKEGIRENDNTFLMSYFGVAGNKISDIRVNLKKAGAHVVVFKNSLARRVLKDLAYDSLADHLEQQTAFVWSDADSSEISKILIKITEDHETVKVKGGLQEGRVLTYDDVKILSNLPSKDVLFAQLMGTIQAPLTRLLGAMNAKTQDLLSILKQYSEQKGG